MTESRLERAANAHTPTARIFVRYRPLYSHPFVRRNQKSACVAPKRSQSARRISAIQRGFRTSGHLLSVPVGRCDALCAEAGEGFQVQMAIVRTPASWPSGVTPTTSTVTAMPCTLPAEPFFPKK